MVLFMTDITEEERRHELERIFHHDILNTALGINSSCRLLDRHYHKEEEARAYARLAKSLSDRLMKEIRVHRLLCELEEDGFSPDLEHIDLSNFLMELKEIALTWPPAQGISMEFAGTPEGLSIRTDPHLLHRVLTNMLMNACEATGPDGTVRCWAEGTGGGAVVCVWNGSHIPAHVAPRIFQRHFTTKPGRGRGVGTYSMKFITESLLGGSVSFTSTKADGTVFTVSL
jgi:signal transduction histidine kinase